MTDSARETLLRAVVDSGTRAIQTAQAHDLTLPSNQLHLFEVALAVIAAGSAARDLRLTDEKLSRLVQARDKLAHVYWLDEIVPGYLSSLVETRVRPAVERARELLGEER
ncbi:MAG: hypothetical protein M3O70_00225 [Actinomycetota bacterium]|nr:hypothetical protein [Actinomycetota bacterium]